MTPAGVRPQGFQLLPLPSLVLVYFLQGSLFWHRKRVSCDAPPQLAFPVCLGSAALGTTKETRGTAYVAYEDIYDAKTACDHLSGFNVANRYLIVLYYNPQRVNKKMAGQLAPHGEGHFACGMDDAKKELCHAGLGNQGNAWVVRCVNHPNFVCALMETSKFVQTRRVGHQGARGAAQEFTAEVRGGWGAAHKEGPEVGCAPCKL
eukprot:scaffold51623_cov22-Tisochrysis_lutea.AAC.2